MGLLNFTAVPEKIAHPEPIGRAHRIGLVGDDHQGAPFRGDGGGQANLRAAGKEGRKKSPIHHAQEGPLAIEKVPAMCGDVRHIQSCSNEGAEYRSIEAQDVCRHRGDGGMVPSNTGREHPRSGMGKHANMGLWGPALTWGRQRRVPRERPAAAPPSGSSACCARPAPASSPPPGPCKVE